MLLQQLDVGHGHAAVHCLAHVINRQHCDADGAQRFQLPIRINHLRVIWLARLSHKTLQNSALRQRSWTKLGQKFGQDA
jgi:hypothetical protein